MFLVTIQQNIILNFQLDFARRQGGPLFNRGYVYFLAFNKPVNKNFNHLIFLFKEIIQWLFLAKTIVCSAKSHQNLQKFIP